METNELAIRARDGDLTAFNELYNRFAQRIFYCIRKKIQNREDAEDVLQEVFIKSYKGLGSLRSGPIYFSSWLFKITNNTINDYFRKKYRRPVIISLDQDFELPDKRSPYTEVMFKSDLESTRENLSRLPIIYQNVLELRFFKELPVKEVAKVINKSDLAVRLIQYQARKRLRQLHTALLVDVKG